MLKKNEIQIFKILFSNMKKGWKIIDIARELNQKYPQVHRNVQNLKTNKTILEENSIIKLNFKEHIEDYFLIECERKKDIEIKYKQIELISKEVRNLNTLCILFGSYAKEKPKKNSDIDLLVVLDNEKNIKNFEDKIKSKLYLFNVDINIITNNELIKMWQNPSKFNVGNEILENHIILSGFEKFVYLRYKYEVGI